MVQGRLQGGCSPAEETGEKGYTSNKKSALGSRVNGNGIIREPRGTQNLRALFSVGLFLPHQHLLVSIAPLNGSRK